MKAIQTRKSLLQMRRHLRRHPLPHRQNKYCALASLHLKQVLEAEPVATDLQLVIYYATLSTAQESRDMTELCCKE
ncbi:hypothetical protein OESDEN_23094 [Oesophagostomum dentatum]|uniref:Uncharacterized protein n=1 Tax=Oesophagostomum dentatum TaxID=61180 RepID=A0A0B1S058_OESDE|nr:hypothetical protein OESDEN_23094 [Oesophagostomum dentatum]